jgi:hypothetical protein
MHVALQLVPSAQIRCPPHEPEEPVVQPPAPSQNDWFCSVEPVHDRLGAHFVLVFAYVQSAEPVHLPPHGDWLRLVHVRLPTGLEPGASGVHIPSEPATLQAEQAAVHELLQQ